MDNVLQLIKDYLEQHNIETKTIICHIGDYICNTYCSIYVNRHSQILISHHNGDIYQHGLATTSTTIDLENPNAIQSLLELLLDLQANSHLYPNLNTP